MLQPPSLKSLTGHCRSSHHVFSVSCFFSREGWLVNKSSRERAHLFAVSVRSEAFGMSRVSRRLWSVEAVEGGQGSHMWPFSPVRAHRGEIETAADRFVRRATEGVKRRSRFPDFRNVCLEMGQNRRGKKLQTSRKSGNYRMTSFLLGKVTNRKHSRFSDGVSQLIMTLMLFASRHTWKNAWFAS